MPNEQLDNLLRDIQQRLGHLNPVIVIVRADDVVLHEPPTVTITNTTPPPETILFPPGTSIPRFNKTCKFCGKTGLDWIKIEERWKLIDDHARIHRCVRTDIERKQRAATPEEGGRRMDEI
jgi:hypothetical protein